MSDQDDSPVPLAPGRSCGDCVACCSALRIDTPEFSKPAGPRFTHCGPKGCAIHATRYPVCRSFFCGWRQSSAWGDEWRPDRSGVILFEAKVDGYATPTGLDLVLTEGEDTIRRPYFAPFVARLVRERRAVFMSVNGRKALLNPHLERIVPLGDAAVLAQLLRFHAGAYAANSPTLPK